MRQHRREIKKAMDIQDPIQRFDSVMEIFNDLQEQRDMYRDLLAKERREHAKLKDGISGIDRSVAAQYKYVTTKLCMHDKITIYYDFATGRFRVITVKEGLTSGNYVCVGVYTAPYDRAAIREDMQFTFNESGGAAND